LYQNRCEAECITDDEKESTEWVATALAYHSKFFIYTLFNKLYFVLMKIKLLSLLLALGLVGNASASGIGPGVAADDFKTTATGIQVTIHKGVYVKTFNLHFFPQWTVENSCVSEKGAHVAILNIGLKNVPRSPKAHGPWFGPYKHNPMARTSQGSMWYPSKSFNFNDSELCNGEAITSVIINGVTYLTR
jgi:hypothetical protein